MARVVIPVNATTDVVELIELVSNVPSRLVDLLVSVRVGIAWKITRVDDVIAS